MCIVKSKCRLNRCDQGKPGWGHSCICWLTIWIFWMFENLDIITPILYSVFVVFFCCRHICVRQFKRQKSKPCSPLAFFPLCSLIASVTSSIMHLLETMALAGRVISLCSWFQDVAPTFQSAAFSKLLSHCCRDYSELGEAAESTSSVSCSCGGTACPPLTRFHFILLFWNHTLTWVIKRK